jgi:hypothetical protein
MKGASYLNLFIESNEMFFDNSKRISLNTVG